jgi:hypothetical protein
MALSAGYGPARRGAPPLAGAVFGGLVAAGEKVWRGGMMGYNAAGALQRLQTAGSVAFGGMASKDYDNTAGAVPACSPPMEGLRGVFALTVPNAGFANIGQPVYATDDNTFTLADALTATFARNAGDTGTGTTGAVTATIAAKVGVYTGTILAGATTFSLVDPTGAAMPNGTLGSAYSQSGVGFTLSNSGTSFVAGDGFIITVESSAGAMMIGTLAGIEGGQTYVKLLGS